MTERFEVQRPIPFDPATKYTTMSDPKGHDANDATEIASELTIAIGKQSILTAGDATSVTVSIGVVALDHTTHQREIDTLVAADNAMYKAKHAGRNRIHLAA